MTNQYLAKVILPAALLIAAALACNLSEKPPAIIITATPSNPALMNPTTPTVPYVTPTPQIVPTPTLPPKVAFSDAEQALHNGDYVGAVSYFNAVITQPDADPELHASAIYGLGEAALREGLYDQASAALGQFIAGYPNDARIPQATFLRGDAYLGLSQWQLAIHDFQTYLSLRPGLIDSYVYERIGDAYLALGQPTQSLDAYAKAADATREVASLVALRERVAAGYLNAGQPQQAVAQYDAILAVAQNEPYRASIQYQAAQVEIGMGDVADGYTRLQHLVSDSPTTYAAYQALGVLLSAGLKVDTFQKGLIDYSNEDYQAAIDTFNTYTSELGYAPANVLMMLGQSYRAVGNAQAALTTFQTVIDSYPADPAYGEAWLEQGRTLFLAGDTAGAIQKYVQFSTDHPDLPQSAEALWRAGYLYSTLGDTQNALATFDILGQRYPGTDWAQEGLFMGATMAYKASDTGMASQLYGQLAATSTGEYRAAAYLWVGRLYQSDHKDDLARQAYEAAAAADPGGYYSIRANDLLNGRAPFQPPANTILDFDDAAPLSEAENWLRTTFGITQDGPLYPLSGQLESDPRMTRGRELLIVGASTAAYGAAENEFEALRKANEDDPLAMYRLAIYFRDAGLYSLSINSAAALITDAGVDDLQVPAYIERLRYPVYYKDLVLPACAEYNLDPLLIFALIRQESLFEGFATSYAAAQGLMQIIPDTGQWIAQQLGWPDYQNSDVYRPYINVQFGTFYLRWILDQVDDLPYVALAGYNGGPGNAAQWLGIAGPDLDLFVQTISLDETRTYIRRIYEQYSIYRTLYGSP
ncbi:MAG TPA: tetratricopeptide repeat protein [Aggregatilineaceae bacterium]|nr:tetratricopeptide repeat protein [Aggregatilineaceae bacterium]